MNKTCVNAAAFLTQTVRLDDATVKFEIWDTAGQERYHSLAPMYYRGAQAAIIVYDVSCRVCTKFGFSFFVSSFRALIDRDVRNGFFKFGSISVPF